MILKPSIDPSSEEFKSNYRASVSRLEKLRQSISTLKEEGLRSKGKKLPVRERIELLKDPGSEFMELSPLVGWGVYSSSRPSSAGIITGILQIEGRECLVIANNPAVKAGAYYPLTVKKHLRAQEIALENRLPSIYLMDSAGAFLPLQAELFPDRDHFGRIFYHQARLSAEGLSQICLIFGHCTAGGAYVPAMSDESIIVEGQGALFLGGPPLLSAATGEKMSAQELGGASLHCEHSGLVDHRCLTEAEALKKARKLISLLKKQEVQGDKPPSPPLSSQPKDIYGMIPAHPKSPLDMKNLLPFIIDGSEFEEFKPEYGKSLLTGQAHIFGFLVGIVANQGVLFPESAQKATHFIDLCDQKGLPLIFFQNITGFMVGKKYERAGIAKEGAKMISAVSGARVPKLTLIVGNSYGAGNYGLCGRAFQPRFLWTWPSAKIAVMGGEQAAYVLHSLKKGSTEETDKRMDEGTNESINKGTDERTEEGADEKAEKLKQSILEQYERESSPYFATARLWDDGLIDPIDTRKLLAMGLSLSAKIPLPPRRKGLYRM